MQSLDTPFDITKNCQTKLWPLGHTLSQLKLKLLRADASLEISPSNNDVFLDALALAIYYFLLIALFLTCEAKSYPGAPCSLVFFNNSYPRICKQMC